MTRDSLDSLAGFEITALAERLIGEDYVPTDFLIEMVQAFAPDYYFEIDPAEGLASDGTPL